MTSTPEKRPLTKTGKPSSGWRRVVPLVLVLAVLAGGCTLSNGAHYKATLGNGVYVHIKAKPTTQILYVHKIMCKHKVSCTGLLMRTHVELESYRDLGQAEWNQLWSKQKFLGQVELLLFYLSVAHNDGIIDKACLTMKKWPTTEWVPTWPIGGYWKLTTDIEWQSRHLSHSDCELGQHLEF